MPSRRLRRLDTPLLVPSRNLRIIRNEIGRDRRPAMAAESKEYATLVRCIDMLEIALTGDRDILHFLEQEGYKVPDDVSNPKSMLSDQEKAGLVVTDHPHPLRINQVYRRW